MQRLLLACLFLVSLLAASASGQGTAQDVSEATRFFDQKTWNLRRTLRVNLGGEAPNALVTLLRSNTQRGESGVGDPMSGIDVLVINAGKCLYRLSDSERTTQFFIDNSLEAKDVTGDGVPEVLFHSGVVGASDWITYEHVIYRSDDGWARDIAEPQFFQSRRQAFCWLIHGGSMLALVAEPLEPASTRDPHMCHGCPKFYQYLVFKWQPSRMTFVLQRSIQSRRDFDDGVNPLVDDLAFIRNALSKPCPP